VAPQRKAAEDLEQMYFGATGMGIGPVLPVYQEDIHQDRSVSG
jgi:hypothetical protein